MDLKRSLGNLRTLIAYHLPGAIGDADAAPIPMDVGEGAVVFCHHTFPRDSGLLMEWRALLRKHPQSTPFQSPDWLAPQLRAAVRGGRLRLLVVCRRDRLAGVLPLHEPEPGMLETPGEHFSDYLDPLMCPKDPIPCWRAMLSALRRLPGEPVRKIVLRRFRPSGGLIASLGDLAGQEGYAFKVEDEEPVVQVPLPATWEDYLMDLPQRQRKEVRRHLKRAAEDVGARLVVSTTLAEAKQDAQRIAELMRASGGQKGRKARWVIGPHLRLCAEELFVQGRLRTYTVYMREKLAAGLVAFPTGSTLMGFATAYDPEFQHWSPGMVLMSLAIRDAIDRGQTVFDLMRGREEYKYRLGGVDVPLHRLVIGN